MKTIGLTKLSDEELMMQFKESRNNEYFETLVSRYRYRLYSTAFNLLGDAYEAEEMVQEAFIRVWRNSHNFRENATFAGWIFTIMQNLCKDIWRTRRRKQSYEAMYFNPLSLHEPEGFAKGYKNIVTQLNKAPSEPCKEAEAAELKAWLSASIEQLPKSQKQVIILRDLEGHSYKSIAIITGVSIGTVRSRLHYGRLKLKEIIK